MILSVIIFNTAGAPRLSKFYTPTPPETQRALIAAIFGLVSSRPAGGQVCSFLDAPELREGFGEDARVVYRCVPSASPRALAVVQPGQEVESSSS